MSSKQISISSLCVLGRGTFDFFQVQEMERKLLQELEWRMNPPTIQTIISLFRTLFPKTMCFTLIDTIYQRAVFFSELVVYDNHFVSGSRYVLAVACFINAMEYVEDKRGLSPQEKEIFRSFESVLCMDLDSRTVRRAKTRLWNLYGRSAQASDETFAALQYESARYFLQHEPTADHRLPHPPSPRGVDVFEGAR